MDCPICHRPTAKRGYANPSYECVNPECKADGDGLEMFEAYKRQSEKTIAEQCGEINRLQGENDALTKKLDRMTTLKTLFAVLIQLHDMPN